MAPLGNAMGFVNRHQIHTCRTESAEIKNAGYNPDQNKEIARWNAKTTLIGKVTYLVVFAVGMAVYEVLVSLFILMYFVYSSCPVVVVQRGHTTTLLVNLFQAYMYSKIRHFEIQLAR